MPLKGATVGCCMFGISLLVALIGTVALVSAWPYRDGVEEATCRCVGWGEVKKRQRSSSLYCSVKVQATQNDLQAGREWELDGAPLQHAPPDCGFCAGETFECYIGRPGGWVSYSKGSATGLEALFGPGIVLLCLAFLLCCAGTVVWAFFRVIKRQTLSCPCSTCCGGAASPTTPSSTPSTPGPLAPAYPRPYGPLEPNNGGYSQDIHAVYDISGDYPGASPDPSPPRPAVRSTAPSAAAPEPEPPLTKPPEVRDKDWGAGGEQGQPPHLDLEEN